MLNDEAAKYGIQFTGEIGKQLSFLDVSVKIEEMELGEWGMATSLYKKPTDNRSYLQRGSYHAPHVFKSVPYSQFLRAKTICSTETSFEQGAGNILEDFISSGYNGAELKTAYDKVSLIDRDERLTMVNNKDETSEQGTCKLKLITHYCKEINTVKKFIRSKQQEIDQIVGQPTSTVFANRRHTNIGDQLFIRRKLATVAPVQITMSNNDNDRKCQSCRRSRCKSCEIMTQAENEHMLVNGQRVKLDMNLNCSDFNIIYVAQCKHCLPGFYFGQSWMALSTRMNGHRSAFNTGQAHKSALALHITETHSDLMYNKLSNFDIGIIRKCKLVDLNMFEDIYIEKYKARIIGLNRCRVSGN